MIKKISCIVVYSEHEHCLEFRGPLSKISACHPPHPLSPTWWYQQTMEHKHIVMSFSSYIILQWPSQDSNRPCNNSFPHWGDDMLSRQQITSPTLWVMLLTFLLWRHQVWRDENKEVWEVRVGEQSPGVTRHQQMGPSDTREWHPLLHNAALS